MDNQNKQRVTECIKDRFGVLFDNENNGGTAEQRDNYSHNCALALDFIGAGKIANAQAMELLKRAINNEFESEAEIIEYIAKVRAPRKAKVYTAETVEKRAIIKLMKSGFNTAQIARCLEISESVVIETIKAYENK